LHEVRVGVVARTIGGIEQRREIELVALPGVVVEDAVGFPAPNSAYAKVSAPLPPVSASLPGPPVNKSANSPPIRISLPVVPVVNRA
jgi:hypothetical protein